MTHNHIGLSTHNFEAYWAEKAHYEPSATCYESTELRIDCELSLSRFFNSHIDNWTKHDNWANSRQLYTDCDTNSHPGTPPVVSSEKSFFKGNFSGIRVCLLKLLSAELNKLMVVIVALLRTVDHFNEAQGFLIFAFLNEIVNRFVLVDEEHQK